MLSRTDNLADHPKHASGVCKFDSTYHLVGLAVNFLVSFVVSAILVGSLVYLPLFIAWRLRLRRERQMIDHLTANQ